MDPQPPPDRQRLPDWTFAALFGLLLLCLVAWWMYELTHHEPLVVPHPAKCACINCHAGCGCGAKDCNGAHRPQPQPGHAGLQLYRWYRSTQVIGWSEGLMQWHPSCLVGRQRFAPIYVVERKGNVAVCRGPTHGLILVPDESARWFEPAIRGDLGE